MGEQTNHDWQPSKLGHGEAMCVKCFMTNREAAALGLLNKCDGGDDTTPPPDPPK